MSRFLTRKGHQAVSPLPPIELKPTPRSGLGPKSASRKALDNINSSLYETNDRAYIDETGREAKFTPKGREAEERGERTRILASIGLVKSYLVGSKAINGMELARAPSQARKTVLEGRRTPHDAFLGRYTLAPVAQEERKVEPEEPVELTKRKIMQLEEEQRIRLREEKYKHRALMCLPRMHPIRRFAITVVESPWFDRLSLLLIIVNSAFIAAQDPLQPETAPRNKWIQDAEIYFTILFTLEMAFKVTAMGFVIHDNSYLRDRWNWLDMFIVLLGWVTLIPALSQYNLSALRTFRVLRPLKTIRGVKGMRDLVNSLLMSVPLLLDVVALWAFALFIFGILGIQVWMGAMQHRCFFEGTNTPVQPEGAHPQTCSKLNGQGYQCPEGQECRVSGVNPNDGITSFDHIGSSFLLIFQTITLEGWTDILYWLQDASTAWVFIYFVVIVFFGSFFVVNLALAVIYAKFSAISEATSAEKAEKKKAEGNGSSSGSGGEGKTSASQAAGATTTVPSQGGGAAARVLSPPPSTYAHSNVSAQDDGGASITTSDCEDDGGGPSSEVVGSAVRAHQFKNTRPRTLSKGSSLRRSTEDPSALPSLDELDLGDPTKWDRVVEFLRRMCTHRLFTYFILGVIMLNTLSLALEHHNMDETFANTLQICNYVFTGIFICEMVIKITGLGLKEYVADRFNVFDGLIVIISIMELIIGGSGSMTVFRTFRLMRIFKLVRSWRNLRKLLNIILNSLPAVGNCSFVLMLFMFIYTILGMQLFGGQFNDTEVFPEKPRANFDNFLWAFVTVFQVLTGENWNEVLFNTMIATEWIAALYFISLVLVGNYVLLNLFQAILLQNFKTTELDALDDGEDEIKTKPDPDLPMSDVMSDTSELKKQLESKKPKKKRERRRHMSLALRRIRAASVAQGALASTDGTDVASDTMSGTHQSSSTLGPPSTFDSRPMPGGVRSIREALDAPIANAAAGPSQPGGGSVRRAIGLEALEPENPPPPPALQAASKPVLPALVQVAGTQGGSPHAPRKSSPLVPRPNADDTRPSAGTPTALSILASSLVKREEEGAASDPTVPAKKKDASNTKPVVKAVPAAPESGVFIASEARPVNSDSDDDGINSPVPLPSRRIVDPHGAAPAINVIGTGSGQQSKRRPRGVSDLQLREESDFEYEMAVERQTPVPPTTPLGETMRADPLPLLTPSHPSHGGPMSLASGLTGLSQPSGQEVIVTEEEENEMLLDNREPLPELVGTSLRLWSPNSKFRLKLRSFVYHPQFETIIIILIVLSSASLALEHPSLDPDSTLATILRWCDITFTTLFALEALVKIMVLGFVMHNGAYLRNGWNVLDFMVVCVSILSLTINSSQFKFLRSLRALRPLRVVSRSPAMKLVVSSLMRSVPSIMNVLLICMLFWLIFGILAVQLFGGKMFYCTDPDLQTRQDCQLKQSQGAMVPVVTDGAVELVPVEWVRHRTNFDNILWSTLALFEIATLEGWPDIMYTAVDAVGVDQAPQRDHNPWAALFFVAFIIVGSFFMVNLFVGVVIDNFNLMKEEYSGSAFLTPAQREWVEAQKMMIRNRPRRLVYPPRRGRSIWNRIRRIMFAIVTSPPFEWTILSCIILNIMIMAIRHYGQPLWVDDLLEVSNIVFTSIFIAELVFKIIALGPVQYWRDNWNRFDAFIVVTSVPSLFGVVGGGATLLRVFRVFRIFKLIRSARGVRMLLLTLLYSLPTLWNVGSLVLLLFFIFAVAGVSLFGTVKYGECLNRHANYENFPNAMLTLFRVSTGEAWNCLMYDCMVTGDKCEPEKDNCGTTFAFAYYTLFIILVSFMLINLFIAVILENFSALTDSDASQLAPEHFEEYSQLWQKYDPAATHFIPSKDVYKFLLDLPPPLGVEADTNIRAVLAVTRKLNIPDHNGMVHYKDLLMALANRTFGIQALPACEARARVAKAWPKQFPTLRKAQATPEFSVNELYAAMQVQATWRGFVSRRKFVRSLAAAKADNRLQNAREIDDHLRQLLSTRVGPSRVSSGATGQSDRSPRSSHSMEGSDPAVAGHPPAALNHSVNSNRSGFTDVTLMNNTYYHAGDVASIRSMDDTESVLSMYSGSEALGLEAAFAKTQDVSLRKAAQGTSPRSPRSPRGSRGRRRGHSHSSQPGTSAPNNGGGGGGDALFQRPPHRTTSSGQHHSPRMSPPKARRLSLDGSEVDSARHAGSVSDPKRVISSPIGRSQSDYGEDFPGKQPPSSGYRGDHRLVASLSRDALTTHDSAHAARRLTESSEQQEPDGEPRGRHGYGSNSRSLSQSPSASSLEIHRDDDELSGVHEPRYASADPAGTKHLGDNLSSRVGSNVPSQTGQPSPPPDPLFVGRFKDSREDLFKK